MKRLMPPMFLAALLSTFAATLLLTGCANLPDTSAERSVDDAKVQAVERAARANGVTIRWVNYPLR
ncbi:MAG: hypothetical protein SF172_18280 [Burkholderiales bacterium]|nr:hypothetical protein [Burkholderiales bacterium]